MPTLRFVAPSYLGIFNLTPGSITNTMADLSRERQRQKQILLSVREYCGSHRISSGHTLRIKKPLVSIRCPSQLPRCSSVPMLLQGDSVSKPPGTSSVSIIERRPSSCTWNCWRPCRRPTFRACQPRLWVCPCDRSSLPVSRTFSLSSSTRADPGWQFGTQCMAVEMQARTQTPRQIHLKVLQSTPPEY